MIGDTGYSSAQDSTLISMRARMAKQDLAFVAHDGDIQAQGSPCTDARLNYVKGVFDGFASPFVYTPGDNEWRNCPDSKQRLERVREIYFSTNQSLGKTRTTVERQPGTPENGRWTRGDVFFSTLNVPGSNGSGIPTATNVAWLNATFDAAQAANAPGVMIIWQDDPFNGSANEPLVAALKDRTQHFGRPVVLVHGDTHTYKLDHPWNDAQNFTRLETFAGGSGKWVMVTVDPAAPQVFSFKTMR
jgi:hypothetical protein